MIPLPILVKTWSAPGSHRFRYIRRSLPSLLASQLPEQSRLIVVDDQSDDPRLATLLANLARDPRVEIWRNPRRMGPNAGQEYSVPRVFARYPEAEFLVLCDDDMIYHPGWLQRVLNVAVEGDAAGLSGIYTALNVPFRPEYAALTLPTSEVLLKKRQAAFNWVIPRAVYEKVGPFRDAGVAYDTEYGDRMVALDIPVICLRPSWVQNIGYFGAYQSSTAYVAADYVGRLGVSLSLEREYYAARAAAREAGSRLKQGIRATARQLGKRIGA